MGKIVVVAEKPSVGRDIARVLGCRTGGDGCLIGASSFVNHDVEAYDIVEKKLGTSAKQKLLDNADAVFNGRDIPICFPEEDRSGLFG